MAVVVSDTSPIRALSFVHRLEILPSLFGEVLIPPAVVHELAEPAGAFDPLYVSKIAQLRVVAPTDAAQVLAFQKELDLGESEALRWPLKCAQGWF